MTESSHQVVLVVNGTRHVLAVDPSTPLLYLLRNDLGLRAAKFGCGLEQCGACTVLVDGGPAFSCASPAGTFAGKEITTLEGLAASPALSRVVDAFAAERAAQCGYCTPGIVVSAVALLDGGQEVSRDSIAAALDPHLCRCGTQSRVIEAVLQAAGPAVAP